MLKYEPHNSKFLIPSFVESDENVSKMDIMSNIKSSIEICSVGYYWQWYNFVLDDSLVPSGANPIPELIDTNVTHILLVCYCHITYLWEKELWFYIAYDMKVSTNITFIYFFIQWYPQMELMQYLLHCVNLMPYKVLHT